MLLKAGVHPKVVQERLGHSSITTPLDIYSHTVSGLQKAAAERLDALLPQQSEKENVGKMSAEDQKVDIGLKIRWTTSLKTPTALNIKSH